MPGSFDQICSLANTPTYHSSLLPCCSVYILGRSRCPAVQAGPFATLVIWICETEQCVLLQHRAKEPNKHRSSWSESVQVPTTSSTRISGLNQMRCKNHSFTYHPACTFASSSASKSTGSSSCRWYTKACKGVTMSVGNNKTVHARCYRCKHSVLHLP